MDENTKKCPECGADNDAFAITCSSCGYPFSDEQVKCSECGEMIPDNLDCCPNCGAPNEGGFCQNCGARSKPPTKISALAASCREKQETMQLF